jgi:hypothetical protein
MSLTDPVSDCPFVFQLTQGTISYSKENNKAGFLSTLSPLLDWGQNNQ